jgi:hypothetical protein
MVGAIERRPTVTELENLTAKHDVEFAVTYRLGPGPNGGGGQYFLYFGTRASVHVPVAPNSMLIYHTHPRGTRFASGADQELMEALEAAGSPQRSSQIIPVGNLPPVRFSATNARGSGG